MPETGCATKLRTRRDPAATRAFAVADDEPSPVQELAILPFEPGLLQRFTVFDVFDPDELGDDSRVSSRFPGYNNINTYRLRDRGVSNVRLTGLLSRFAVRREGALTVGYIHSRYGTDIGVIGEGVRRLVLTFSLSGSIVLASQGSDAVSADTKGLVYRGGPGTRLLTTDESRRVTIAIDEARICQALGSLLEEPCRECPEFAPVVDWAAPAVAPITRMVRNLIEEIGDPTGLVTVPAALETFTDTLTHVLLARLPHNRSERLHIRRSPAIPVQLRRAEAFIEANAGQPISLVDIAAAAGCGTRALQLAFRRFRDTTPLAALRDARLQAVRAALRTSDAPATLIARGFGFSNATRFRNAFRARFGENPIEPR